jgi:FkbM family methyltransferase
MDALRKLLTRPDFRINPALAVWRRASWRVRWQLSDSLWIHAFGAGLQIALPRRGTAVQIHYNGLSEPDTANFLRRFVQPGMTVWDVGAHIGEYTILAAQAAGPSGRVHAFEANPAMLGVLETNVALNRFTTVTCSNRAVSDRVGTASFVVRREPARSSLHVGASDDAAEGVQTLSVATTTLDEHAREHGVPGVIKVDVGGSEVLVLRGGTDLLARSQGEAPVIVFSYSPATLQALGFRPNEALELLLARGYGLYQLDDSGQVRAFDPSLTLPPTFNMVASKSTPVVDAAGD